MASDTRSDTELVLAARGPDPQAFNTLFERWFPKAWNVARNILRDDDLAADIAQDAVLTAWQQLDELDNVDAFGGWLLRIARNRALNKLDRERRSRSSDDETVTGLRDQGGFDPTAAARLPEPDRVLDAHDQQELVWAASAALGANDASLLDLHLRHGLSAAEIAQELGVSANTAHQQLFRLRGKLGQAVGSYLLWRHGRPLCENLASAVSGSVAFDQSVSQAVTKHEKTCSSCAGERKGLVSPAKLFSSAPLVVMPLHLQARAAAALVEAGVPVTSPRSDTDTDTDPDSDTDPDQPEAGQSEPNQASHETVHDDLTTAKPSVDDGAGINTDDGKPFLEQHHRLRSEYHEPTPLAEPVLRDSRLLIGAGSVAAIVAVVASIWLLTGGTDDNPSVEANLAVETSDDGSSQPAGSEPGASNSQASSASAAAGAGATLDPTDFTTPTLAPAAPQVSRPTGSSAPTASTPGPSTPDSSTPGSSTPSTSTPGSSTPSSSTPGSSSTNPATTASTVNPTTPTTVSSTRPDGSSSSTSPAPTSRPTGTSSPSTPTTAPSTPTTTPSTPTTTPTTPTTAPTTPSTTPTTPSSKPPTTPDPTDPPPSSDPPVIQRFISTSTSTLDCGRQQAYLARWSATNTDSVTLSTPAGSFAGGSSGQQSFCGSAGQSIGLVATGPGGQDKASAQL